MKNRAILPIIAIFFPLFLMLIWLATLYLPVLFGTDIRLRITAYDPRSFLSGHYLLYTIDYGVSSSFLCSLENANGFQDYRSHSQCVCFKDSNNGKESQVYWAGECKKRPNDCNIYLEGHCENGRFVTGIERYYFPEKFKIPLATLPEKSSLIIKVFQGKGVVQRIEVEGMDILEYAAQKNEALMKNNPPSLPPPVAQPTTQPAVQPATQQPINQ